MTVWENNVHRFADSLVVLTEAQARVMRLLAEGRSHGEVANRLYLSVATVRSHSKTVRASLEVRTTDEAIVRLRGLGLLE